MTYGSLSFADSFRGTPTVSRSLINNGRLKSFPVTSLARSSRQLFKLITTVDQFLWKTSSTTAKPVSPASVIFYRRSCEYVSRPRKGEAPGRDLSSDDDLTRENYSFRSIGNAVRKLVLLLSVPCHQLRALRACPCLRVRVLWT